ncbi:MAG TPA: oxygenase MpaB family protein [Kofleriaceae bacterium]
MIVSRADLEAALASLADRVSDPCAGIYGPESTAWRLAGDLGVFLGGGRAALLQLAHPMVAYAVAHHSHVARDVIGRFQRTFRHVFAMAYGELDDAVTAARRVHAVHMRITGEIPIAIGAWPAGARYHANDVDALRWVHATLADTTIAVRRRLGYRFAPGELDRYTIEMSRFGALFGIAIDRLPRSWREHEDYMAAMLASDQLEVAPVALEMSKFLLGRGGPGAQPPLGRLAELLAADLLPERLRAQFELAYSRVDRLAMTLGFRTLGRVYERLPRGLVAIPAHAEAKRRLAGKPPSELAAWAERTLFGLSKHVTGSS